MPRAYRLLHGYRYRIFEKLDVANDAGLIKLAIKRGIIEQETVA